jgi:ketosteroid isomerase-like protein
MKLQHFIFIILIFSSCQKEDNNELKHQILEADRSFSKMAAEKGVAEAFLYYADEKVIKPSPGRQPLFGKFALLNWYKDHPVNYKLSWEPLKAEASGDLGYTFGGYTLITKTADGIRDTTQYGNYVSIWKRKKDGSWRYVLDTGNPTPAQVVLQ